MSLKKISPYLVILLLAVGIIYQVAIFYQGKSESDRPSIPKLELTLLDDQKVELTELSSGKHTVVFLIRTGCDFCKQQMKAVGDQLPNNANVDFIFVAFEDIPAIEVLKREHLPIEDEALFFAQGQKTQFEGVLEEELVFPYMLWYDEGGTKLGQYRGVFPVSRILEVSAL